MFKYVKDADLLKMRESLNSCIRLAAGVVESPEFEQLDKTSITAWKYLLETWTIATDELTSEVINRDLNNEGHERKD